LLRPTPHSTLHSSSFTTPHTTMIYTLSLHDALPIYISFEEIIKDAPNRKETRVVSGKSLVFKPEGNPRGVTDSAKSGFDNAHLIDRKSTRLNSSHVKISYAVFCLKKKKTKKRKQISS